jgi:energy-coupling factor transporter ATP-binding protein EcfA2
MKGPIYGPSVIMPLSPIRITRVDFDNFKALENYSLSLEQVNIIVGPNNAGKSTVLSAFRALDTTLRAIRSRAPTRIYFDDVSRIGYRVPDSSFPIALENVHTNYQSTASRITFTLSNRNKLQLIFPAEGGCVLVPVVDGQTISNAASFKRCFPISLTVVPVLGPVEHNEARRERATVVDGLSTHRASHHFRNYWHYFSDGFADFAKLIRTTWPGMEVELPEFDASSGQLKMFCREDRLTRELYWVGFGFQIWCQLLTHLSRSKGSSLVIVDEPETYLHPDVQRQLLGIARDLGCDILFATHSSEIMSEADPAEIVVIDKKRRAGERLRNIVGVQRALDAVGSAQNITLTSLARSRRVLFVEGVDDFRLLRRFARRLGLQELASGAGIVPLPSGGFGSWSRVTTLAAGIAEALGSSLSIAAIYDRDYYSIEHIKEVVEALSKNLTLARVHARKEIENYLLIPSALGRALDRILTERDALQEVSPRTRADIESLLIAITDPMRDEVMSQLVAKRSEKLKPTGRDPANIMKETIADFNKKWDELATRLTIVPGKEVLRTLRAHLQEHHGVSLTDARIVDAIHRDEIPEDLKDLLRSVDAFRTSALDAS